MPSAGSGGAVSSLGRVDTASAGASPLAGARGVAAGRAGSALGTSPSVSADAGGVVAGRAGGGALGTSPSVSAGARGVAAGRAGGALGTSPSVSAGAALAACSGGAVAAGVFRGAAVFASSAPGRAEAVAGLDRVLLVAVFAAAPLFAPGLAAAVFRLPAAALARAPVTPVFACVLVLVAPGEAGAAPSAAAGGPAGPAARAPLRSSSVRAACRPPVRDWPTALAGCPLAARLGAGPVPPPGERSPGAPFSDVTGP